MGLTGGVKSHRLSGQISPYCEKKRHWLCAYCAPMFHGVSPRDSLVAKYNKTTACRSVAGLSLTAGSQQN